MEYSVYISSDEIQMVKGASDHQDMVKLDAFVSLPMQEGSMINGVITDAKAVEELLIELREQGMNSCRLIIDSGQILLKNVKVPFLKPKQLLATVQQELSDLTQSEEELIYDYSVLKQKHEEEKNGEILCCGIEVKLLESYLEVFQSAGIQLTGIDVSINALCKLTQEMEVLQDRCYILILLDGNHMISLLFDHNDFILSSRARLFSPREGDAFLSEVSGNLSQMLQFAKAQHHKEEIDQVYFCHLSEAEGMKFPAYIKENLSLDAEMFPQSGILQLSAEQKLQGFSLQRYILAVAGLFHR